jgi:glutathione S-transferase
MRRSSGAHFDGFLRENGSKFLVCRSYTYPDRSLFQIVESLRYAFPKAMVRLKRRHRGLTAHQDRIAARACIRAYLNSPRRLEFCKNGIFRRYPELDG